MQSLPEIWYRSAERTIPEAEQLFNHSFSSFINSPILKKLPNNFKICPTASNSIDLIAAVLNHLNQIAVMVEPTFDNLALLLRRRGVNLSSVNDIELYQAAEVNEIDKTFPDLKKYNALVIVHPNNPTGLTLSENGFRNIISYCKRHNMILVIDNCFRVYRRNIFDDYNMLVDSSISFMAFEDTGKVWPTQDLKASLVYFSDDLKNIFCEIYNEVYLCVSNLTLGIISTFFDETTRAGVQNTIWDIVDKRRSKLRNAIEGSKLSVTNVSFNSNLPVEWLTFSFANKDDFVICQELKQLKLAVLPGRQFYWNSSHSHHNNIRVSLMKRETVFAIGLNILHNYCKKMSLLLPNTDDLGLSVAV